MKLTREQQAALDGPAYTLVKAAAGSGKTQLLVERACRTAAIGNPQSVVALTFSRRAAAEMKDRLSKRGVEIGYVGTVHGWCLNLLNNGHSKANQFAACPPDLHESTLLKNLRLVGSQQSVDLVVRGPRTSFESLALARTRAHLLENGLIDYDCMLETAEPIIRGLAPDIHLLVDEYQDSGEVERRIYSESKWASLFVVADPNQLLYEFRGATADSLTELLATSEGFRDGGRVFEMTQNHRSTPELQRRFDMILRGFNRQLLFPFSWVITAITSSKPNVVICGQNRTVDRVCEALKAAGVEHHAKHKPDKVQLAASALLSAEAYPDKDLIQGRIRELEVNYDTFAFDDTLAFITSLRSTYPDATSEELSELALCPTTSESGINVTTVHGSKGLQWDHVAFIDDLESKPHHNRMRYVGCTRAKQQLDYYAIG